MEDAPNIFRRTSSVGKIGLQFYKYPLKQLEVIADFLPQNKKTTFKQKAQFWIPYFFVCGLMGFFPFFDWGDKLLNEKFKLFPKDFLQKLVIHGTQEILGKDSETGKLVGKVIMYGAPALANVDISGRTGLASVMPQETSNLLFGATGSTIYGVGTNLAQGDPLRALQSLSPGLYNIVAAIEGETRDARGRKTSAYEDMHDRIIRGLGFKSVDESLAVDVQRINFNERDETKKLEQRAIDAYIADPSPENLKRLKELGISGKRVKEERGKKNLTRLERFGRNKTKDERKRNEYLLDFAR